MSLLKRIHYWWLGRSDCREKSYEHSYMMDWNLWSLEIEPSIVDELKQVMCGLYDDLLMQFPIHISDRWGIFTARDDWDFRSNFNKLHNEVVAYEKRWFIGRWLQQWRDPEIKIKQAIVDYVYKSALFVNIDKALKYSVKQPTIVVTHKLSDWQEYSNKILELYEKNSMFNSKKSVSKSIESLKANKIHVSRIDNTALSLFRLESEYQKIENRYKEIISANPNETFTGSCNNWFFRLNKIKEQNNGPYFLMHYEKRRSHVLEMRFEAAKRKMKDTERRIKSIYKQANVFYLRYLEQDPAVSFADRFNGLGTRQEAFRTIKACIEILDQRIEKAKAKKFTHIPDTAEIIKAYHERLDKKHVKYREKLIQSLKNMGITKEERYIIGPVFYQSLQIANETVISNNNVEDKIEKIDKKITSNDSVETTGTSYAVINETMVNNDNNKKINVNVPEQTTDSNSSVGEETKYKYDQDKNQNLVEETTAVKPADLTATIVSPTLHQ